MLIAMAVLVMGLLVGSFLNVCIYRLPRDLSVVRPRSFCPKCGTTIRWYDNIPVLSYLLLKGRCRHCGKRIDFRYPAVEALTAALFVVAFLHLGLSLQTLRLWALAALLLALIFTDLETRILPDELTLGGAMGGLALAVLAPLKPFWILLVAPEGWPARVLSLGEAALGATVTAGLLWLMGAIYRKVRKREGMGLGDVKMAAMLGAFFGLYEAMLALLIGSLLGSVTGLAFITATGKKASEYELPFGSFLGAGGLAVGFLVHPLL